MERPRIQNNFYVITGGPGVGKTALLQELRKRGYKTVPEIARELIREQQAKDGNALPWRDRELYRDIMFERSVMGFKEACNREDKLTPIFFDRGFLDAICYGELIQSPISKRMQAYAKKWRYNPTVFILPPWKEIYQKDSERKQDWAEAVHTFDRMLETYSGFGYKVITVPRKPVQWRADVVLEHIGRLRGK
ncbi:AAA family ATPase [Echinicola rosea]|uniref:ATPase n=1 Tax=Echinicola rosea TaxID=1807691 RepID=A0ABQ1V9T3_9BACT|nr:AAA family ATPase [Echinicola rosea]GGF47314.1 ATPase [Echinicola rosea]